MSKYIPLNLKFYFSTKEGRAQFKSLFYRIYINIFGIFIGIKIVPLRISKRYIVFWYKGDEVWWKYPWKRKNKNDVWISLGFSGTGEFGDAIYPTLKSIDNAWDDYLKFEKEIWERENQDRNKIQV